MVSKNRFTSKDINISEFTLTNIAATNSFTLFLQAGLPEKILLALTDFVEWTFERALLRLIVLLGQTSPTLRDFLEQVLLPHRGLLAWTLITLKVLLGRTSLPQVCLLGQIELTLTSLLERAILEVIGLLKWMLLPWMGLLGRTELVYASSLERTSLSPMDLRTYFIVGLSRLQTELRTVTLHNMGKSSSFKLKPVSHANSFEETDTISLILLELGLMKLYIEMANLAFASSVKCSYLHRTDLV